ncbi:MAG: ATPase P, partial [Desulfotomaculaceae bacterium]
MLNIEIPGKEKLTIKNIVLDFNGTIALDGVLLPGVQEKLNALAVGLNIYILTADTFGTASTACAA